MTLKRQSPFVQAFEVISFSAIIVASGYFFDNSDPLLVHYEFSFLILWLAIVTLFYGLNMGLLMWTNFAVVSFFGYKDDPVFTSVLLENLFFVFLFGLFFSNLHSEIDKYKIKTNYLQLRLKELTNAFFTLKISHDKLESIYIIQPASFRFVIAEILESSEHNVPTESAKNTLRVLKKFFSVNSAIIWRVKKGKPHHPFASIGNIYEQIDPNDRLVQEAIAQKRAVYLNDLENKEQTSYLYAIPFIDKRDNVVAILIIKEIPFLFYHEDTLLKINVVFNYIWTEYKKRASLDRIVNTKEQVIALENENHERQDIVDFKLEIARLNNILEGFNIDSRIYVMATTNRNLHLEIADFLYNNQILEILDQYIALECKDRYVHFILIPFVSNPAMFQKSKELEYALENRLRMRKFDNALKEHLSLKDYKELKRKHTSVRNFNSLLEEFGCA